jgi:hypothetical protein
MLIIFRKQIFKNHYIQLLTIVSKTIDIYNF